MTTWDLPGNGRAAQRESVSVTQHTNRTEGKGHANLSKGTEKALDKTQCLFMIKTLKNKERKESSSKL